MLASVSLPLAIFTCGVFHSVPDLIAAIDGYLDATNANPQPFTWTASADQILDKVRHCHVTLEAINN